MSINNQIALIILAVSDLSRATKFYHEAFDWPQVVDAPVYAEFTLPNNLRLGLYERVSFSHNIKALPIEPTGGSPTGTELYLYSDDL